MTFEEKVKLFEHIDVTINDGTDGGDISRHASASGFKNNDKTNPEELFVYQS